MNEPSAKRLLILDGQGGGVGRRLAEHVLSSSWQGQLLVVGSNAIATANMMKAGSIPGATGEAAWVYNCAHCDLIAGPIGIILPHAMHGEISPAMATSVTGNEARKILIPVANPHIEIAGLPEQPLARALDAAVQLILAG